MSLIYLAEHIVRGDADSHSSSRGVLRPGLYIGGKVDAKDRDRLDRWKVTHILNMTPAKDSTIQAGVPNYFSSSSSNGAATFCYKRIPIYDASTSTHELRERAEEICAFIANGLLRGSVLVHCSRGVSRSTTAVVLFLMRRIGMTLEESLKLVKRRRPQADPIPAFLVMLQDFEKTCLEKGYIAENNATSTSKKRAVGPSLPGSHPLAKRAKSIGPAIGPLRSPPDTSTTVDKVSRADSTVGEQNHDTAVTLCVSKRAVVVGPSLPEPLGRVGGDRSPVFLSSRQDDDAAGNTKESRPKTAK